MMRIGSLMLLLALLGVIASVIVGLLSARIAAGFARDTRQRIFRKVENFSNAEFDKFSPASLITRSTNDITQLQMVLIMLLRVVFYAPIMAIGGIIKASLGYFTILDHRSGSYGFIFDDRFGIHRCGTQIQGRAKTN